MGEPARGPLVRAEVAGILLIGLVALALRGIFLANGVGNLDADNATIGLMASHILQGHHYVFFWGLAYMGSLEAYVAAMYFAALGPGDVALQLAPLTFSVAFLVSGYLLARQIGGVKIGLVALGLLAVGPRPSPCGISRLAAGTQPCWPSAPWRSCSQPGSRVSPTAHRPADDRRLLLPR